MPTKINLATKPFSNRSLPWAITAVVIVFSLISLIFIVRATATAKSQAYAVQNDINLLSQEEQRLRQQADAVKSVFARDIRGSTAPISSTFTRTPATSSR